MTGDIELVELERMELAAQGMLSKCFGTPASIRAVRDHFTNNLVLTLIQAVAGENLERVECSWPDGWWQAFLERWAPRWWLKRHPVRMRRVQLEARGLYPKLSLPDRYGATVAVFKREYP